MRQVDMHEAKNHLSRLLAEVAHGAEVIITRGGRPVAILSPYTDVGRRRRLGRDAGLFEVPEDFDAPLKDEVLRDFEG